MRQERIIEYKMNIKIVFKISKTEVYKINNASV